ncbi:MAG: EamA family transporter [Leptolyngbya sp. SIO4C1]|nr:EamA family transporter [Leptolyngbya sp. SIO4C1]
MLWFLCAGGTACFEALKDVTGKQTLKALDEYAVLFGFMSVGAVLLFGLQLLTGGFPTIGPQFGLALLAGGSLNILAYTLYVRAIKVAELSLTVPLITLTPLFLLATSPLIVQEWPTWADAVGVLLLVVGSYILNWQPAAQRSVWAPLAAIVQNQGSRLMLGAAFLWSITSNFDKIGTLNSSPLFWGMSLFIVIAVGMVPLMFRAKSSFRDVSQHIRLLGITGLLNASGISLQFLALTLAPVAQVIAVKRLSALIAVVLGHFVFQEPGMQKRLLGAAIMVSGVAIMALR